MKDDILCAECAEPVQLAVNDYGNLLVSCGCERTRAVKVSKMLPMEWQA